MQDFFVLPLINDLEITINFWIAIAFVKRFVSPGLNNDFNK